MADDLPVFAPDSASALLGGATHVCVMPDGWHLRVGIWRPCGRARGTLVFMNGRGDFLEKYAPFCAEMAAAGYAVVSWDWRGQGLSGRIPADASRSHLTSFDPLVADGLALLAHPLLSELPRPWFAGAHSMGANMLLRLLASQPALFARAVLLAPMLAIGTAPMSPAMARRFVRFMCALGRGAQYAPGQGDYGPAARSRARQNRLTGDAVRFAEEAAAIDRTPGLAIGGVTYAWTQAAYLAIDAVLAPGVAEALTTPILMCLAGEEQVVDSQISAGFAARLPHAQVLMFAGARHELLRETDAIRSAVIAAVQDFLAHDVALA